MFGRGIRLFKLLGFEVRLDMSWIVIAVLVTWSLAAGLFPHQYQGLTATTYWIMGVAGAIGLFASIIFHEFAHSIIARRFGIPMRGITLFIFGGVAEMGDEPPNPKSEFYMAIAGPIASIFLSIFFFLVAAWTAAMEWPQSVTGVIHYLGWINMILVIFNAVPAFPLDGGRVLRSLLWAWKGSLRWATRISASIGSGFGIVLIVLGFFSFFAGNFIGGIWYFLLGMFIRSASQMSYQQVLLRRSLEGEPVRRFMKKQPVTVPASISVHDLVNDYIYKYHYKFFPVSENGGKLLGCVTLNQVKQLPREEWDQKTVRELATPCSRENSINPDADAVDALGAMQRTKASRLLVVDDGKLVGVLSLKDLLEFLSLKIELEGA
jgi:Zn-dependent protease/CBS domain-containing protein